MTTPRTYYVITRILPWSSIEVPQEGIDANGNPLEAVHLVDPYGSAGFLLCFNSRSDAEQWKSAFGVETDLIAEIFGDANLTR